MLRRIPRFLRVSILFVILAAVTLTVYQSWSTGAVGTGGWTQTQWGPLGPADRDLLVKVRQANLWEGHYGDLGFGLLSLVLGSTEQPETVDFFLCGPPAMIHDALEVIDALDVDPARVHTELFDFV